VKRVCAIDSTGFSVWRYVRWLSVRHGRKKRRKDFLKLHFIVDCKSLLIPRSRSLLPSRPTRSRWRSC
jgi:hypothetical protein